MIGLFPVINVDLGVPKRGIATRWGPALEIILTIATHHEHRAIPEPLTFVRGWHGHISCP